ncbi:hypothetical protein [Pseudolactococcus insecticola]|uniref:Uncharacterized protein n=1 Tax=Pseudolactococcus insecticola TaxID=2709158 RepID=A0A6A0B7V6_9LACT|nr:hypothetical protein [Lactococcus insecticola]GFH41420.1 hypothetical protein Hs20B_18180 [Lactococcus insecticola]
MKEILFEFDEEEHIRNERMFDYEQLIYEGELDKSVSFEEWFKENDNFEYDFSWIVESFNEALIANYGAGSLIMVDNHIFEVSNNHDTRDLIYNLNFDQTQGYQYTSDFTLYADAVTLLVHENKNDVNNDGLYEKLYNIALESVSNSGEDLDYIDRFGFDFSTASDFFYLSNSEFFKNYYEEYGYEANVDESKYDLATRIAASIQAEYALEGDFERTKKLFNFDVDSFNNSYEKFLAVKKMI